jgi:hypothetical protein
MKKVKKYWEYTDGKSTSTNAAKIRQRLVIWVCPQCRPHSYSGFTTITCLHCSLIAQVQELLQAYTDHSVPLQLILILVQCFYLRYPILYSDFGRHGLSS